MSLDPMLVLLTVQKLEREKGRPVTYETIAGHLRIKTPRQHTQLWEALADLQAPPASGTRPLLYCHRTTNGDRYTTKAPE